jgi:hypothetical protein
VRGPWLRLTRVTWRGVAEALSALALKGVALAGAATKDLGLLTTPQLHHAVRSTPGGAARGGDPLMVVDGNVGPGRMANGLSAPGRYAPVSAEWEGQEGYYTMAAQAWHGLLATKDPQTPDISKRSRMRWPWWAGRS